MRTKAASSIELAGLQLLGSPDIQCVMPAWVATALKLSCVINHHMIRERDSSILLGFMSFYELLLSMLIFQSCHVFIKAARDKVKMAVEHWAPNEEHISDR